MACLDFAARRGLPASAAAALAAFGGPAGPGPTPRFEALEAALEVRVQQRADAIVAALDGEVDRAQAELFARRFLAVAARLAALSARSDEARLLAVGLERRAEELLAGPAPRALRVRALADFYYSRAAVLYHRLERERSGREPETLEGLVAGARWRAVAPGIWHAEVAGELALGPAHVNLLRIAPGAAALRCADLRGEGGDLVAAAARRGAVAAVSGGFFLYSEPDIAPPSRRGDPVGLLIADGVLRSPPVFTRAALVVDGTPAIRILGPRGAALHIAGRRYALGATCRAYSRADGPRSPADGAPAFAVVGERVVAAGAGPLPIPLAGLVVHSPGVPAPPVGAAVRWLLPRAPSQAVAGGPMLVRGGRAFEDLGAALAGEDFRGTAPPRTFSGDETGDQNLLPRMAAGLSPSGELYFAAADGRSFYRALGLTLRDLARLMIALGCAEAMNLDGGSSKRMVVSGAVVDLPSTEIREAPGALSPVRVRPVHSAVFIAAAGSGPIL